MFLVAHLPYLPPTLEDIDSVNFAMGVREFDIARHQPHPPGYPVFIALGKASTALLRRAEVAGAEARGLAIWSALSGAALVGLIAMLFAALRQRGDAGGGGGPPASRRTETWATVLAVASPLFWFTALRPLSDMTGLAGALAAQALLVSVINRWTGRHILLAGAFLGGLAIGIRSQTFLLTLPLLGLAIVAPHPHLRIRDRVAAVAAAGLGVLAWGIPLIWASGGLSDYAAALGSQAGEDFSGVVMLWNVRSARVAADALMYAFLWPWGGLATGAIVTGLGVVGVLRVGWRQPRALALLAIAFGPYAIFHLLFHEAVTVRYALPLVVPVAYLAAAAVESRYRWLQPAVAGSIVAVSLAMVVPAAAAYGRQGSPVFAAFRALERGPEADAEAPGLDAVSMHASARRAAQWERGALPMRLLEAPHGREWLALVEEWRARPQSSVGFVADPRRTDLALIDPAGRRLLEAYRWPFAEPPFVGGARPGGADLYWMTPPRWMLDRGWSVGAEVAGVTARDRLGPHVQPSVAWVRGGSEPMLLMLGGRNLGPAGSSPARITLTSAGGSIASFDAAPGFFFHLIPLPAGTFPPTGTYLPMAVASSAVSGAATQVALEQFDLQGEGTPMTGVVDGWQEPEYNPSLGRAWRWASDRATLWVRPIGRDVTLVLEGESPLRYFDAPPNVVVSIGGREIGRFTPATDFRQSIRLPADALAASDGRVVIASDKWFVPGDRGGTADARRLSLRIYSYAVR